MDDVSFSRALHEGAVVVRGEEPELLRATGSDRTTFLHRLLTADIAGLAPGAGRQALLLDTKGHVTASVDVLVAADEVLLAAPAGQGEKAGAALARYAVMDDFQITVDKTVAARLVLGAAAPARLATAGVAVPALPDDVRAHAVVDTQPFGAVRVVRARSHGGSGLWLWVPVERLAAFDDALAAAGVLRATHADAEPARIRAGQPRWGFEITAEVFPMEVGLSPAIDYGKGCYLGQEPIVRIRDRGHINWRLVGLRLAGADVPAPGDRLEADAKEKAGRVTSAAADPDGGVVALALLHTSLPTGTEVRVRHGEAVLVAQVVEA